jgi:hypothetical protein
VADNALRPVAEIQRRRRDALQDYPPADAFGSMRRLYEEGADVFEFLDDLWLGHGVFLSLRLEESFFGHSS